MNPSESSNDLYGYNTKLKRFLERIKDSSFANKDTVLKFIDALKVYGVGTAKLINYAQFSYEVLKVNDKPLSEWSRDDVNFVMSKFMEKSWSGSTLKIACRTLRRLIHYAKYGEIADGNNIKYCYEVEHLHPDRYERRDKREVVKANDLLTKEEFLRLVDKVPKVSRYPARDKALLYVMYEFASRPSELLNMKIKGVRFYDNYCEITTHGKTGVKTLALVLSYQPLREWLEAHPEKDNPEAWLWYSKPKGRISYDRLRIFLKKLAKEANIKKRVWLYLIRHTALTNVEKEYGSSIAEIYGNWRKGSPIRNRYIHLANSDQREAVLRKFGLKVDSSNIIDFRECYRCNTKNEPNARICKLCGLILDQKYANSIRNNQQEKIKELEEKIEKLTILFNELRGLVKARYYILYLFQLFIYCFYQLFIT
jgi:site-specific recombinase XerD